MDFNFKKYLLSLIALILITGCDVLPDVEGEYLIGNSLDSISSQSDQGNSQIVSFFDSKIKKIHIFDLQNLQTQQSFNVKNPKDDHYLVANNDMSYVIDLSPSQMSIYRSTGTAIHNPIRFNGRPISAAFAKAAGRLVVYDDLASVGFLQLDPSGEVTDSWVGGPVISQNHSIVSGDLSPDGQTLLLGLSSGDLAIIDVTQSMANQSWVYEIAPLGINDIKWIAPLSNTQALLQDQSSLILYDYQNKQVVDTMAMSSLRVTLYSKQNDPHVLYKNDLGHTILVYVQGGSLQSRQMIHLQSSKRIPIQSVLNQSSNVWNLITHTPTYNLNIFDPKGAYINITSKKRSAESYRFNDMLNLSNRELPDQAQLKQASHFIFALFPSELGYIEKIPLLSEEPAEKMKNFNLHYIKK
ncbi:MAG: hypothetical protein M9899_10945 [Bdellovibrionaceae bacterium]|nr:hypothetical protein [Pseudobdellovibrionaceae bacterium]